MNQSSYQNLASTQAIILEKSKQQLGLMGVSESEYERIIEEFSCFGDAILTNYLNSKCQK